MSATRIRIELEPDRSTPHIARQIIGTLIDRGPAIKAVDAALLASELVTAASRDPGPVVVTVEQTPGRARVSVSSGEGPMLDELVERLLDRLADLWKAGPPPFFEIDLVRHPRLDDLTEESLWERVSGDSSAREEIFTRYADLAGSISRRFRRSAERADLEQVAYMALVGAIDRFDPTRGVKFSTYASKTISGELKRHLRDTAWSIKVPRGLKEKVLRVTRIRESLRQELGRAPTMAELAEAADLSEEQVNEALGAGQAFGASSLDAPMGEDESLSLIDTIDVDYGEVDTESWLTIQPVLEELSERDREVLRLRFFEDMSQTEIADILGVSQMQVSRILSSIFDYIRRQVETG
ncbi:MAG: sigma-70 family RNA polymerase sigma factor [Acidimicrobiia bacterium]